MVYIDRFFGRRNARVRWTDFSTKHPAKHAVDEKRRDDPVKHADHGISIRFSRKTCRLRLFCPFLSQNMPITAFRYDFLAKHAVCGQNMSISQKYFDFDVFFACLNGFGRSFVVFCRKALPCPSFFDTVSFQRPQLSNKSAIVERNARFCKIPREHTMFFEKQTVYPDFLSKNVEKT